MKNRFQKIITQSTEASSLFEIEKIQDLWSGYGTIKRYGLKGSAHETVVVKHVCLPESSSHPRGWNTKLSHRRKLKSYQVESSWYRNWSEQCGERCYVPKCLALESSDEEFLIVLEDLNSSGFDVRKTSVSLKEVKLCLQWLAHFHASFLGKRPDGLWSTGTYWHLDTRPDEFNALKDKDLKYAARAIDQKLHESPFQTFVHGDAKLANFCFSKDGKRVAAVDFQYVGGGCGMKDVAYLIGSCLQEDECEKHESELLDYYFGILVDILKCWSKELEVNHLVDDWRELYPVAWADFHRFLKGWSPGHWKIHSYSERLTRNVIETL